MRAGTRTDRGSKFQGFKAQDSSTRAAYFLPTILPLKLET
jgi:hypothetical protein